MKHENKKESSRERDKKREPTANTALLYSPPGGNQVDGLPPAPSTVPRGDPFCTSHYSSLGEESPALRVAVLVSSRR